MNRFLLLTATGMLLANLAACRCMRCERRPLNDRAPASDRNGRYLGDPIAPPPGSNIPPPPGGLPAPSIDTAPPTAPRNGPPVSVPDSPYNRSFRNDTSRPSPEILMPERNGNTGPELMVPDRAANTPGLLGEPVRTAETTAKGSAFSLESLPGFARAKEGIATGRTPTNTGWDTLKAGGYRTVVYLHDADSDVADVRSAAEKRGLTFVSIPMPADKFADAMRKFNDALADKPSHPVYVFDENGVRTGSAWYAHYRTQEFLSDDEAKVKAARLGLSSAPASEQTTFWVAVQKYLATR